MFETSIAGIPLKNGIYNASGCMCRSYEELHDVYISNFSGAVLSKSCTTKMRSGNPSPRYTENNFGSLNSMGLPNFGYQYYLQISNEITEKPYFMSVSGMSQQETLTIINEIDNYKKKKPDLIEINLSCPNLPGKPQIGYDWDQMEDYIRKISEINLTMPWGIKLPPYFDPVHFGYASDIIKKGNLSFITSINSIGNALWIDPYKEETIIHPKNGLGGLGGSYVKPTSLANVNSFYKELPNSIDIIGCGGISSGNDVWEFILCGASAVQIGTQLVKEGNKCFERISNELTPFFSQSNYKSWKDARGKLKTCNPYE